MQLSTIQLDVYRRLNFADSPASSVVARILTFINQRHRQLLTMPGMDKLREGQITFATVANQALYGLGPSVSRIKTIYDTTNDIKLVERDLSWLRWQDPSLFVSGTPTVWIPRGFEQVQSQPSAATGLYVDSTSAGDTGTAYIEGVRTGGYRATASVAMTGTTNVQIGTLTDWIQVDKFYLSTAAVGTVTLETAASGGTVLATIVAGQTYARYLRIQLWPTPSTAVTTSVDYTQEIQDMANATDQPLLPEDFHYLLSLGARLDEYEKADDDRREALLRDWELGVRRLREYVVNNPDKIIIPGMGDPGISNLGPWYPRGAW